MSGRFSINIRAGSTTADSTVSVSGTDVHIIRDVERRAFRIGSDDDLKRAVERYFGRYPTDAYLHSPTPWGDLYKRYGWEQVETVLVPKSWTILQVSTQPIIMAKDKFDNSASSRRATFSTNLSAEVKSSVTTSWSNSTTVSMCGKISYGANFGSRQVGGEISMNFLENWGRSITKTKDITLRASSGVSVVLDAHETAEAELNSNRGVMKVRVVFEAYLRGYIAVNYYPRYKDHHFWALDVGAVLGNANKVKIVEDINVGYYTGTTLTVKDKHGKAMTENVYLATHAEESSEASNEPSDELSTESSELSTETSEPSSE